MSLVLLKRVMSPEHAKDVKRLKSILNKNGYDAADADIEAAYGGFSLSLPHKPGWHPLSFFQDDKKLLEAMLKHLAPETPKEIEL